MENVTLSDRMIDASADSVTAKEADAAFERTEPVGVGVAAEADISAVTEELPAEEADGLCVEVPDPVADTEVVIVSHDDVVIEAEALPVGLSVAEGDAVEDAEPDELPVNVFREVCDNVARAVELKVTVNCAVALTVADEEDVTELDLERNVGSDDGDAKFDRTLPEAERDASDTVASVVAEAHPLLELEPETKPDEEAGDV